MTHTRWERMRRQAALLAAVGLAAGCLDSDPTSPIRPGDGSPRADISAADFTGDIRIGVVPVASAVTIGSEGAFVVRSGVEGETVLEGSNGDVVVSVETPPQVANYWWLQVVY